MNERPPGSPCRAAFSLPVACGAALTRLGTLAAALLLAVAPAVSEAAVPVCGYEVVHEYPHDPTAFTEGLLYRDGLLYESTGRLGVSRIMVRKLDSAEPVRQVSIDPTYFGEGLIDWGDELISLTWRDGIGYRWDRETLEKRGWFRFGGEGWGMTRNAGTIYQSDGTSSLLLRDPETMTVTGALAVTADGAPVRNLNELEWIGGEIWANIWLTDRIARIDPATGEVKAWVDLAGLAAEAGVTDPDAVLNGIAYDAKGGRIFVTGKDWPLLFEIRLAAPCAISP